MDNFKKAQTIEAYQPKEKHLLEVYEVSKYFPGVVALDQVNFDLQPGEVHCLMGENGAGKSTIVKILAGVYQPDGGTLYLNGQPVVIENRPASSDLGLAFIFQELSVVTGLTVADNIVLGNEPSKGLFFDKKAASEKAQQLLNKIGFSDINPNDLVGSISVAQRQAVMIARALYTEANIIVMDEPTSSLSMDEADLLLKVVGQLRSEGKGIIYVSHRMSEIYKIADRITVFKDGNSVATRKIDEVSEHDVVNMMVGREVDLLFPAKTRQKGDMLLRVAGLKNKYLKQISFDLHQGEILGISGLVGAGRTELLRAVFGADPLYSGTIELRGEKISIRCPGEAIKHGISLVPEDRRGQGIIASQTVKHNLMMIWSQFPESRKNNDKENKVASHLKSDLNIKTPSLNQKIVFLSGGNQQKVVVGKWLACKTDILLLDEPTRGIDIGAKLEMYRLIDQLARQGIAVILVSSEMPEVLGLADRILVMRAGKIVSELDKDATEKDVIKKAMFSIKDVQ